MTGTTPKLRKVPTLAGEEPDIKRTLFSRSEDAKSFSY